MDDVDQQRLMVKVARLYHTHGMRQTDIARRLQISQSRVSRLLTQAEEAAVVRTVVAVPPHIHAALEEQVEEKYPVNEVHIVDTVSDDGPELALDLAHAMAALLQEVTFDAPLIGFTSWSQTLQLVIDALQPMRLHTEHVVELLGDLGPPQLQHEAARSTQRFASLVGAQPVYLRTAGVVTDPELRILALQRDPHVQEALSMLDRLDLALIGIGACEVDPSLRPGDNFFTDEQFEQMRELGAAGEVCLHFIDAEGSEVPGNLDDLIVGVTREQLRSAQRRWAVAGGVRKHAAIKAALTGGWVDTLVTDTGTAAYLVG